MKRSNFLSLTLLILLITISAAAQTADEVFKQGQQQYGNKQYEAAIASFQKYLGMQPNDAGAYYNIGLCYRNLDRYSDSIEAFRSADRSRPNDGMTQYWIASNYYDLKQYSQAVTYYREATRLK